jgi:hypothetical protein
MVGMVALPNLLVIGAMKCGTTALHRYLGEHPQISMAGAKEVNFFSGPEQAPASGPQTWWMTGQWHRGLDWYASLFDPAAPVRGESSPAYTSPDQTEAVGRIAATLPHARLLYVVRDPADRALSQYAHHRRDGAERRPVEEALLDPASQYVARSRYHERLAPYLEHFPLEQVHVVVQERLLHDRRRELARCFAHAGADPDWWSDRLEQRWHVNPEASSVPPDLRRRFDERVRDDVEALRDLLGDGLREWDRATPLV